MDYDAESVSSYDLSNIDSPQTAWRRKQEQLQHKNNNNSTSRNGNIVTSSTSEEEKTDDVSSEEEEEEEEEYTFPSVISRKSNDKNSPAEHVDGFFRNLNMDKHGSDDVLAINRKKSFHHMNASVALKQRKTGSSSKSPTEKSAVSMDSLSTTDSCSSNEDGVNRREGHERGPRPAYSESNMHNSLGYLPWILCNTI